MLKRTTALNFTLTAALAAWGMTSQAYAQDMPGEMDDSEDSASEPVLAPEAPEDPNAVRHGVGLRARYIFVPKALIELFLEEAPSGVSQSGFGLDYIRRKKDFEFSVGFEYDKLSASNGYFVEHGGDPLEPGTTDFVEFDGLSWFTIDAAFVYHHKLSSLVSLRYGGGIGLGLVTGDIIETDAICNGSDTQNDCVPINNPGGQLNEKQDIPSVFPVFNVLGGVQITPARNLAINIELGMRTVFYTGVGVQYFY